MYKYILPFFAIASLASCCEDPLDPSYNSVNDFGIAYGTEYDYQLEDPTTVLGEGTCIFVNDTTIQVIPGDGGSAPFTQTYAFGGDNIRIYYDDSTWETLDYYADESVLQGLVTPDTRLIIFID